jgi:hypothetical protein
MASGNLGLVYLTHRAERATEEELRVEHPGLVEGIAAHPGVGLVLVLSQEDGPVAIGSGGRNILTTGMVEGVDPLEPYGPLARQKLLRHNSFGNVPDLLILSFHDPHSGEVAAFEELIGSHGGMGGEQSQAFVLHPRQWSEPDHDLVGAPTVHQQLVRWMEEAGARPRGIVPRSDDRDQVGVTP